MNRFLSIILLLFLIVGCREPRQEIQFDSAKFDYAAPAILTGRVLHSEVYPDTREITVLLPFLDMLNDIIQQSGGQVLYISLGAAWCEPCRRIR